MYLYVSMVTALSSEKNKQTARTYCRTDVILQPELGHKQLDQKVAQSKPWNTIPDNSRGFSPMKGWEIVVHALIIHIYELGGGAS